MKVVAPFVVALALAGSAGAEIAMGAGKATFVDIVWVSAPFGPPAAGAATVGLHNERDGRLMLTHLASFGVRSLVHEPGSVPGDGSVRVSLPAGGPPDRAFFDVFAAPPANSNHHLFRLFGDLTGPDGHALIGLLLPAVQKVREAAARAQTTVPTDNGLFQNLTWDIEVLLPGARISDISIAPSIDSFFDIFVDVDFGGTANRALVEEPIVRVTFTGDESPVPAPAAGALLAGAGLLAARRRRR